MVKSVREKRVLEIKRSVGRVWGDGGQASQAPANKTKKV
jgi:hypothetical protein